MQIIAVFALLAIAIVGDVDTRMPDKYQGQLQSFTLVVTATFAGFTLPSGERLVSIGLNAWRERSR